MFQGLVKKHWGNLKMLLRWIKDPPFSLAHLAFLLLWLYFSVYQPSWLSIGGLVVVVVLVLHHYKEDRSSLLGLGLATFCFFAFFVFQRVQDRSIQVERQAPAHLRLIPDTIKINGDALSFRAKNQGKTYQVFYTLKSEKEKKQWQGQTQVIELTYKGGIEEPEGQRNFRGFDYQAYLKTQGIYYQMKMEAIQSAIPVKTWNLFDWLSQWRRQAIVWSKEHFPLPMNQYMTGLLFGYLDTDFEEMDQLYSSLGIIHLFALSGMQVGFFINGIRKMLLRLGILQETVDFLMLPISLVYAGLTGFSVSVVRSLVQKILSQKGIRGMENMAMTLMLLMLLMPKFLLTAGGVLSCAYAFILTLVDSSSSSGIKKVLVESFWISLGILPLLTYYFSVFQPWSILLTFLFSFLFDLVLLPGLTLLFLLSILKPLTIFNNFFLLIEECIRWIAKITSLPLVFGQPSGLALVVLLLLLGIFYDTRKQKGLRILLCGLILFLFCWTKHPLENEITVVDIGQGDSIFLRDWRGRTILIDVGGRVDFKNGDKWQERSSSVNAEKTLIPYLKSRGVGKLDALVLTHTDQDHMGDMVEVTRQIPAKRVYVSSGSLTQAKFREQLKQLHCPIQVVKRGERLPIFDSNLEVLAPDGIGDGKNDDSIVLYGQFYQKRFLFTGDLEEAGEKKLLSHYPQLQVDVLKVGHHGSKGSSSDLFLDQVHPQLALISVGKNNRYRHPHKELLDRLEKRSIAYLRTDERGAIRLIGWDYWRVETVR